MPLTQLPALPTLPSAAATAAEIDAYNRAFARVQAERHALIETERMRLWEADIAARETPEQRAASLEARQRHAQAQADTAVQMAASVAAQRELAAAMAIPPPSAGWTEANVVRSLLFGLAESGVTGQQALSVAQTTARLYRTAYRPPVQFPTLTAARSAS